MAEMIRLLVHLLRGQFRLPPISGRGERIGYQIMRILVLISVFVVIAGVDNIKNAWGDLVGLAEIATPPSVGATQSDSTSKKSTID